MKYDFFEKNKSISENTGHGNARMIKLLSVLTGFLTLISLFFLVEIIIIKGDMNELKNYIFGTGEVEEVGSDAVAAGGNDRVLIQNQSAVLQNDFDVTNDMSVADPYEGYVKVYLTFDDGPSGNTDKILDILAQYGIKATFFLNCKEGYEDEYERIVAEGHAVGIHSYEHVYKDIYGSLDGFAEDFYESQMFIYEKTGVMSDIYRFPGGSSNQVGVVPMTDCIDYLNAKGITYFDWNVSAQDAIPGGSSTTEIVNNVMGPIYLGEYDSYVVLFHDSQDKNTTVEALPIIIENLANMENVVIVPIDENTIPVQHDIF